MVPGGDPCRPAAIGGRQQELPAQPPEAILAGQASAAHPRAHVPAGGRERDPEGAAEPADVHLIAIGLLAAQAVVEMGRDQPEVELLGDAGEAYQEGRGIGPAAHRDQQPGPRGKAARASQRHAQCGLDAPQTPDRLGWWRRRDSNPGHRDYDSPALPTELRRQVEMAWKS